MTALPSTLQLSGGKELERRLLLLDEKVRKKGIKKAVAESSKPIIKNAKKRLRPGHGFETGLLKLSLKKLQKWDKRSSTSYAVLGPVWNVTGKKAETIRATLRSGQVGKKTGERRPYFYAHLVEQGTKFTLKKYPFLAPAFKEQKSRTPRIMKKWLLKAIKEAAKARV